MKARYGLTDVVRLNWNENLDGALPGVLEETATQLAESWAYPEESYEQFRSDVARWAGASPDEVVPGHGIQALTLAIVSAFISAGDEVVIPRPTYGLYAQACGIAGATVTRVDCGPSLALDLPRIAEVARERGAKLVWICDPNNPTGLRLPISGWGSSSERSRMAASRSATRPISTTSTPRSASGGSPTFERGGRSSSCGPSRRSSDSPV